MADESGVRAHVESLADDVGGLLEVVDDHDSILSDLLRRVERVEDLCETTRIRLNVIDSDPRIK